MPVWLVWKKGSRGPVPSKSYGDTEADALSVLDGSNRVRDPKIIQSDLIKDNETHLDLNSLAMLYPYKGE